MRWIDDSAYIQYVGSTWEKTRVNSPTFMMIMFHTLSPFFVIVQLKYFMHRTTIKQKQKKTKHTFISHVNMKNYSGTTFSLYKANFSTSFCSHFSKINARTKIHVHVIN